MNNQRRHLQAKGQDAMDDRDDQRPVAGMHSSGTETILVAEDDEILRKLVSTVLQESGYTVILAENGDEAVLRFIENKDTVQLAILDMIMPKKNGKEVYDAIRAINPDLKTLFVSGYTADIIHKNGIIDSKLDFIMKPLSPLFLLKRVREILDR
jgi:DNA-binding response OmpR family regulator